MQRLVAAVAGLLEAAEGEIHVPAFIIAIHPHRAGAQAARHLVRGADVGGPHRGREAVFGVVGDADGVFHVVEGDDGQHRAEDFFAADGQVGAGAVKRRRFDEQAGIRVGRFAAEQLLGAFAVALADVGQHLVVLDAVHDGAHIGGRVQRVLRIVAGRGRFQLLQEARLDVAVNQHTGTGGADFAHIVEDAAGGGARRLGDVRAIRQNDVGRFAAQFQPDALEVGLRGVAGDQLAHAGGAGEGDAVHIHVQRQQLAHVACAGQHLKHAAGDAGFFGQRRQADGGERGFFRRLDDHWVAGGQRRTKLPAGHHDGIVPRYDGGHHADGFAGDQAHYLGVNRRHFAANLVDGFGEPFHAVGAAGQVHAEGVADGLAHIQGFQQRQLIAMLVDQRGEALEDAAALARRQAGPGAGVEGLAGGAHRALHVGFAAPGHVGQLLAVGGVVAGKAFAVLRRAVLAGDEGAPFDLQLSGELLPFGMRSSHLLSPLIDPAPFVGGAGIA